MKVSVLIGFGFLALTGIICFAAPEPAIVPEPTDWTVNVSFEHPQQIVLKSPINNQQKRYWYTIITIVNRTKQDVDFFPKCELMTDTFQILPAGKHIPMHVFERIKMRHQSKFPFLELLERVDNKILQGLDSAKDIAIIWEDFDDKSKRVRLFIAGLSNETAVVVHPMAKDKDGTPLKVYLRKTLELTYSLGGDPTLRDAAQLTYKSKRWIMR